MLFKRKPEVTILVIDDDSFHLTVLKKILTKVKVNANVSIDATTSAAVAFEKIEAKRPDLVLCDFHLLQIVDSRVRSTTGLELWKKVQKLSEPPPFLILSGIGEEAYRKAVVGISNPPPFQSKPYQADILIQTVEAILIKPT